MKEYRMAKRAIVPVYILLSLELVMVTVGVLLICGALRVSGLIPLAVCWALAFLIMCVAVPNYFKSSKAIMSEKEIICITGAIVQKRQHMPMDAVKSVTQVMTPFGDITGLNFIIVNALGSKLVIPFMADGDCDEAAEFINGIIAARGKNS